MATSTLPPLFIDKILLFGDDQIEQSSAQSIGYNIAPALQRDYWGKLQLITHGYHGYTSELGRHMIDPILTSEMPSSTSSSPATRGTVKLLIIAFGTNDSVLPSNTHQHVPSARYVENISHIVSRARAHGVKYIVLVSPALANELAPDCPADRSTLAAKQYGEALASYAKGAGIPILNLWSTFAENVGWRPNEPLPCLRPSKRRRSSNLDADRANVARGIMMGGRYNRNVSRNEHVGSLLRDDGVHLSRSGYGLWYGALVKIIRERWPEMDSKNMSGVFPRVEDVDMDELPGSLFRNMRARKE